MGKIKRGAFAALGGAVWKAGSRLGWRYAKQKLNGRHDQGERMAKASERTAAAAERTATATEKAGGQQ